MQSESGKHVFQAENVHFVCIFPFCYGQFAKGSVPIDGPRGIFVNPSPYSQNLIGFRRQTFSPELEWHDPVRFFSIQLDVIALSCRGQTYRCIHSDCLLTVYPELICTLQMHVELEEPVEGVENVIEIVKYLREISFGGPSPTDWIRCQFNSGIVEFASFHALTTFIRNKFSNAYNISSTLPDPASFIFPVFYVGLVTGCNTADDIIERYRTEISGILNLWPHNYDLQTAAEIQARTSRNLHPLNYGASFISSAGFFEFHPRNVAEIARREGINIRDHHFQEIYYATTICEIAVAQYFSLRICDDILDKKFASSKISFSYVLNPLLSLVKALGVLKFERYITIVLSSIRSIGLTRKPYTREILGLLNEQFDTPTLQDRVAQKVAGINRILTSMFQSVIATTTFIVAIAAAILTAMQIIGVGNEKPPPVHAAGPDVHQASPPHP